MNEWEWQLLEDKTPIANVRVAGVDVGKGDLVQLQPAGGGDIFDLALTGRIAQVESIEQDYEGQVQLAVVLQEDPGKDLGLLRQPGHRFFFKADEVVPIARPERKRPAHKKVLRILVAGIGNIFLGDDGYGVEVIRRLAADEFPANVQLRDFGIRGYDLAYALLDGYDTTILVDAASRGAAPGTIHVIELDTSVPAAEEHPAVDGHAMTPDCVLRLANAMGSVAGRIVLVACEPATLGGDEGEMGLSEPVAMAVDTAAALVRKLAGGLSGGKSIEEILKSTKERN